MGDYSAKYKGTIRPTTGSWSEYEVNIWYSPTHKSHWLQLRISGIWLHCSWRWRWMDTVTCRQFEHRNRGYIRPLQRYPPSASSTAANTAIQPVHRLNQFLHQVYCTRTITISLSSAWFPSVLWRCWLGGRKGIWPVKNWVVGCWRGYLSGAQCRLAYGPADATATHCLLLQW